MSDVAVMNYGFLTSLGEREIGGMGAHTHERQRGGATITSLCFVVVFTSFGYQPWQETT